MRGPRRIAMVIATGLLVFSAGYAAGRSLGADALLRRRAAKSSSIGRFVDLAG